MSSSRAKNAISLSNRAFRLFEFVSTSSSSASSARTALAVRRAYSTARAQMTNMAVSNTYTFALPAAVAAALSLAAGTTAAHCSGRSEQTYIMVKPDGVNRALVGEIISRFEKKGYKLVAAKVLTPDEATAKAHYAEHDGKPFFPKLVTFLTSGPVVALVFEGKGVIAAGRKMIGSTNPLDADPSTIRGQNCIDVGRNCIHGSDSVESAQREIALWFKSHELSTYERVNDAWVYE